MLCRRQLCLYAALAGCCVLVAPTAAQQRKVKNPELRVLDATIRRIDDQLIAVDGKVENSSAKTFQRMLLVFEFFAPGQKSIVIQKGPPDPDVLAPGETAEFHLQLRAPARAVRVTIEAADGSGRELRVENSGPYPVE